MTTVDVQLRLNESYDRGAESYEAEPGHGVDENEKKLYARFLATTLGDMTGKRVLDVGSGTGVFSRIMASLGCEVVGMDPSAENVRKAKDQMSMNLYENNAVYRLGDTHDQQAFTSQEYDVIVSRQAVCCFRDPIMAFENWLYWLRPGGRAVVIDGCWKRGGEHGWNDDELVDALPLSCVQTRATLGYLLTKSGFQVERNEWLSEINQYAIDKCGKTSPRYIVVARKA